ncbi:LysR family transcriptional regulator [Pseudomonas sp. S60]|uniref:LysR family transcriptional regulator n=1 Tax=unclassified Pseudomonas TaxID=196821 RepID=UPI0019143739|nr:MULTISPECIES: LysR family transcriptional regulator [unclassified Pseudomonas]MBK5004972.1 LysR family transcriptional regulator [Pseudomonas sp. S32]MBK5009357.1 LysR family transcriptional regulator [Pseudomonas sp. S60]
MDYQSYLAKSQVDMLPCMAAFAVVVEAGSFVDASTRLGLTASAVSKQVSKLENALSIRLLERSTRQLRVSAEGAQVYSHCKELLESSANVFRFKEQFLETPQGLIRVVVPRSLYSMCHQLVPEFLQRYPGLNVQLISKDGAVDFIGEGVDVVIRVTDSPPLELVARKLFPVEFIVCASGSYLEKHGNPIHPSILTEHSCISLSEVAEKKSWKFTSAEGGCEVCVSGRYVSDSLEAVLNATVSGLGISCLPVRLAAESIASNTLVEVLPEWKYAGPLQGMAWILYQPGRHASQRVKVMVEYLVGALRRTGGVDGWINQAPQIDRIRS